MQIDEIAELHVITDEVILLGAINAILHEHHAETIAEEVYWFVQRKYNGPRKLDTK